MSYFKFEGQSLPKTDGRCQIKNGEGRYMGNEDKIDT